MKLRPYIGGLVIAITMMVLLGYSETFFNVFRKPPLQKKADYLQHPEYIRVYDSILAQRITTPPDWQGALAIIRLNGGSEKEILSIKKYRLDPFYLPWFEADTLGYKAQAVKDALHYYAMQIHGEGYAVTLNREADSLDRLYQRKATYAHARSLFHAWFRTASCQSSQTDHYYFPDTLLHHKGLRFETDPPDAQKRASYSCFPGTFVPKNQAGDTRVVVYWDTALHRHPYPDVPIGWFLLPADKGE